MKTPIFWYQPKNTIAKILSPLGCVYGLLTARRFKKAKPYQSTVPVICVGNLTVGGTGKTPVCLALHQCLKQKNKKVFFLNRGYKGIIQNAIVDLSQHSALDVGDESVLLSLSAPVVVDANRVRGAQLAERNGAEVIIMDDGFQNPSLVKTLSFVVMDGKRGFGNECLLPAGPLREPILTGLKRADAIVLVGDDSWGVRFFLQRNKIDLPILTGRFQLNPEKIRALKGRSVFAFAGIGLPQKFYESLTESGIVVADTESFPDHCLYTQFDMERLFKRAGSLPILTTTKDAVKLTAKTRKKVVVIDGEFVFDQPGELDRLLKGVIE